MLKIKACFVVIAICVSLSLAAQRLQVEGASPNLYITHTVAAKENWYSIGRIYNQSPKEIAPFNSTTIDKPLAIGQKVKIPLTDANFSQDGAKAADELFVPLYHTVQDKEWMYRISTNYNKVPPANIEKWNNIKNDQLKAGMNLIVGYLKVKSQSSLASQGSNKIQIATAPPIAAKEQKAEEPKIAPATTTNTTEVAKETKPEIKEDTKPIEARTVSTNTPASHKGGSFKQQYVESGGGTAGNAGVFKSVSGWNDGKYYALMNNVPVGTIVKVSFSSTNKSVYAKVLGQLPEMKESVGLTIRISDAAASELGAAMNKFYVDVKY